ncbi:MAG: methyltransferase domain-containing protein, partial [Dehalococcoidia bacterium]|nr:methyltransferase domain-containing protein [Dehalococcoidia bacterium]
MTEHYLNKRVSLISRYVKGGPILDIGCGTGRLAGRLQAEGYQVVGADASLGMLRLFQSRTGSTPVGALADALPFRSG